MYIKSIRYIQWILLIFILFIIKDLFIYGQLQQSTNNNFYYQKNWLLSSTNIQTVHSIINDKLSSEYFYIGGKFINSVSLPKFNGGTISNTQVLSTTNSYGSFVLKVHINGSVYWSGQPYPTVASETTCLSINPTNEDLLVAGNFSNGIFIVKYNKDGNLQWTKTVNQSPIDSQSIIKVQSIQFKGTSNFYITGSFKGKIAFDNGKIIGEVINGTNGQENEYFYFAEFSVDQGTLLNVITNKVAIETVTVQPQPQISETNGNDTSSNSTTPTPAITTTSVIPLIKVFGEKLVVDSQGNTYIAGIYNGTGIDFYKSTSFDSVETIQSFAGKFDIFIVKYSSDNQLQWLKTFGGAGDDLISDIYLWNNNIYLAGTTTNSGITFDASHSFSSSTSAEWSFIVQLNTDNGNIQTVIPIGKDGTTSTYVRIRKMLGYGNTFYTSGVFISTFNGMTSPSTFSQFVIRYSNLASSTIDLSFAFSTSDNFELSDMLLTSFDTSNAVDPMIFLLGKVNQNNGDILNSFIPIYNSSNSITNISPKTISQTSAGGNVSVSFQFTKEYTGMNEPNILMLYPGGNLYPVTKKDNNNYESLITIPNNLPTTTLHNNLQLEFWNYVSGVPTMHLTSNITIPIEIKVNFKLEDTVSILSSSSSPLIMTEITIEKNESIITTLSKQKLYLDISNGKVLNTITFSNQKFLVPLIANVPKGWNDVSILVEEGTNQKTNISENTVPLYFFDPNTSLEVASNVIIMSTANNQGMAVQSIYKSDIPSQFRTNLCCILRPDNIVTFNVTTTQTVNNELNINCNFPPSTGEKAQLDLIIGYKFNSTYNVDISKNSTQQLFLLDKRNIRFGKENTTNAATQIDIIDKMYLQQSNFTYQNIYIDKTISSAILNDMSFQVQSSDGNYKTIASFEVGSTPVSSWYPISINVPKLGTNLAYLEYNFNLMYKTMALSNMEKVLLLNYNQIKSVISNLFINGTVELTFTLQNDIPSTAVPYIYCNVTGKSEEISIVSMISSSQFTCRANATTVVGAVLQLTLKTDRIQKQLTDSISIPSPTALPKIPIQFIEPVPLFGIKDNFQLQAILTSTNNNAYLSLFSSDRLVLFIDGIYNNITSSSDGRYKAEISSNNEGWKSGQVMAKLYPEQPFTTISDQSYPIYFFNPESKLTFNNSDGVFIPNIQNLQNITIIYEKEVPKEYWNGLKCKLTINNQVSFTSVFVENDNKTITCRDIPNVEQEGKINLIYAYNSTVNLDLSNSVLTFYFVKPKTLQSTQNLVLISSTEYQKASIDSLVFNIDSTLKDALVNNTQLKVIQSTSTYYNVTIQGTSINVRNIQFTKENLANITFSLSYKSGNQYLDLSNAVTLTFIASNAFVTYNSTLFKNGSLSVAYTLQNDILPDIFPLLNCRIYHPTKSELLLPTVNQSISNQLTTQLQLSSQQAIDENSLLQLIIKTRTNTGQDIVLNITNSIKIPEPLALPLTQFNIEPSPMLGIVNSSLLGYLTTNDTDYISVFNDRLIFELGGKSTNLVNNNGKFSTLLSASEEGWKSGQVKVKFYTNSLNVFTISEIAIPMYFINPETKIAYNDSLSDGIFIISNTDNQSVRNIVIMYEKEIPKDYWNGLKCQLTINNQVSFVSVTVDNDNKTIICKDIPNVEQEGKISLVYNFNSTVNLNMSNTVLNFYIVKMTTLQSIQNITLITQPEYQKERINSLAFRLSTSLKDVLIPNLLMKVSSPVTTSFINVTASQTSLTVNNTPINSLQYSKINFNLVYKPSAVSNLTLTPTYLDLSSPVSLSFYKQQTNFTKIKTVLNKDQSLLVSFTFDDSILYQTIDPKKMYCSFNNSIISTSISSLILATNFTSSRNEWQCILSSNYSTFGTTLQAIYLNELNNYDIVVQQPILLPSPSIPNFEFYFTPNASVSLRDDLIAEITCEDASIIEKFKDRMIVQIDGKTYQPIISSTIPVKVYVPLLSNNIGWVNVKILVKYELTDTEYSTISYDNLKVFFFNSKEQLVLNNNITIFSKSENNTFTNLELEFLNTSYIIPFKDLSNFYCKILGQNYSIQTSNEKPTKFSCINIPLVEMKGLVTFGYQFNQTTFVEISSPMPFEIYEKRSISLTSKAQNITSFNVMMLKEDTDPFTLQLDIVLPQTILSSIMVRYYTEYDNVTKYIIPTFLKDSNSLTLSLPTIKPIYFFPYHFQLEYKTTAKNYLLSNETVIYFVKYNIIDEWSFISTDDNNGRLNFHFKEMDNLYYFRNSTPSTLVDKMYCKFYDNNGIIKYSKVNVTTLSQYSCDLTGTNFTKDEKKKVVLVILERSNNELLFTDTFDIFPFQCYGVISTNTLGVCNGKGKCIGNNLCQCQPNYYSINCSITTCYEILSNQTNVCNGNGKCISYNTCECSSPFIQGEQCNQGTLFINKNNQIASTNRDLINSTTMEEFLFENDKLQAITCQDFIANENLILFGVNAKCFLYNHGESLVISFDRNSIIFINETINQVIYLKKGLTFSNGIESKTLTTLIAKTFNEFIANGTKEAVALVGQPLISQQSPIILYAFTNNKLLPGSNLQYNWSSSNDPIMNQELQKFKDQPIIKFSASPLQNQRNLLQNIQKEISLKIYDPSSNQEITQNIKLEITANQNVPNLLSLNNPSQTCYNLKSCFIEVSTFPTTNITLSYKLKQVELPQINGKSLFKLSSIVTTNDLVNDTSILRLTVIAKNVIDQSQVETEFQITVKKKALQFYFMKYITNAVIGQSIPLSVLQMDLNTMKFIDVNQLQNSVIWSCKLDSGATCNEVISTETTKTLSSIGKQLTFTIAGKHIITVKDSLNNMKQVTVNVLSNNNNNSPTIKFVSVIPETIGYGQQISIMSEINSLSFSSLQWRVWKQDMSPSSTSLSYSVFQSPNNYTLIEIQQQTNNYIISKLNSGNFIPGFNYLIRLEGTINNNEVVYVEKEIKIQFSPTNFRCDVYPKEGIAFETDFSIFCNVDDNYLSRIEFYLSNNNNSLDDSSILLSSTKKYRFFTKLPYIKSTVESNQVFVTAILCDVWNGKSSLSLPIQLGHPIEKKGSIDWGVLVNNYLNKLINFDTSFDVSLDVKIILNSFLSIFTNYNNYETNDKIIMYGNEKWKNIYQIILQKLNNLFDVHYDSEDYVIGQLISTLDKLIDLNINNLNFNSASIADQYLTILDKILNGLSKVNILTTNRRVIDAIIKFINYLLKNNLVKNYSTKVISYEKVLQQLSKSFSNYNLEDLYTSSLLDNSNTFATISSQNIITDQFILKRSLINDFKSNSNNILRMKNNQLLIDMNPNNLRDNNELSLLEIQSYYLENSIIDNNVNNNNLTSEILFLKTTLKKSSDSNNAISSVWKENTNFTLSFTISSLDDKYITLSDNGILRDKENKNVTLICRINLPNNGQQSWIELNGTSLTKGINNNYIVNCSVPYSFIQQQQDTNLQFGVFFKEIETVTNTTGPIINPPPEPTVSGIVINESEGIVIAVIVASVVGGLCFIICFSIFSFLCFMFCCCRNRFKPTRTAIINSKRNAEAELATKSKNFMIDNNHYLEDNSNDPNVIINEFESTSPYYSPTKRSYNNSYNNTPQSHAVHSTILKLNGQYEIKEMLQNKETEQSTIITYRAIDLMNNSKYKNVVVKKIIYNSISELNNFTTNNIYTTNTITHENICPIIEIFLETRGMRSLCIVKPYYEHGTLLQLLLNQIYYKKPFKEEIILQIFKQTTKVLEYLHFVMNVNQNLSPQNIFIDYIDSSDHTKIKIILDEIYNSRNYIQLDLNEYTSPEVYTILTAINNNNNSDNSNSVNYQSTSTSLSMNFYKSDSKNNLFNNASYGKAGTSFTSFDGDYSNYQSAGGDNNISNLLTLEQLYASDIFSLGCLLYQLMTLNMENNICQLHISNEFNEMHLTQEMKSLVNYSDELVEIVVSMLKRMEERPNARELLLKLSNFTTH